MTKRVQHVRDINTASDAFIGLEGEITYDTTDKKLRAHDGVTPGGIPIAREDLANVAAATTVTPGKMSATDKQKLDGIEAGAEVNPDAAEIKSLYESNGDTNALTDALLAEIITNLPADIVAAQGTVQGNLDTHTANVSNPHSVTRTQVGLGIISLAGIIAGSSTTERIVTEQILKQAIDQISGYVGDHKFGYYDPSDLPVGWIFAYDSSDGTSKTIGNAASGADHAHVDFELLFTRIYNRCANAQAAVSGGRGANAAADFAANKTITIPNPSARAIIGSNPAVHDSLSIRVPGVIAGAETHTLTPAEGPIKNHTHPIGGTISIDPGGATVVVSFSGAGSTSGNPSGGEQNASSAHNNVQPSLALDVIIKYK